MKKWLIPQQDVRDEEMSREFGELLGGLLTRRGIHTMAQAQEFFMCEGLSDPYLLRDMDKAVELIRAAVDEGRKITVYGDYDCDGVTSTVMLCSYLEAIGAEVDWYIPSRAEGYGMNLPSLERLVAEGTQLVITVDNGISAIQEAQFLREQGIELVITDHHQPLEELPVCGACVNPHRADDNSPFKELCGAGVALKLLCALEEDEGFVLEQYSDLAAIGTVGDVMPLRGENRFIVRRGLDSICNRQNLGVDRLLRAAGVNGEITATTLAFSVCPRINAAGRVADAQRVVRLLMTDSAEEASRLAEEVNSLNDQRRGMESEILSQVQAALEADPSIAAQRIMIVSGEGWNHGVVGLVCSRLLEKYGKPVFAISMENGVGRGSARSIDGFPVHKMLAHCGDLLIKYGGHPKAGGFSLEAGNIEAFRQRAYEYCASFYPKMPVYSVEVDMVVQPRLLTVENVELLGKLEPFGEGNRQPLFMFRDCVVCSKRSVKDGKFVGLDVECGGVKLSGVSFRYTYAGFFPKVGERIDLLATVDINEYNGVRSVSLKVVDVRPAGFAEDRFFAAQRVYEEVSRGEGCDKRLAPRIIPDRPAMVKIYDLLRTHGAVMTAEDMAVYGGDINYCMLRIALDALQQAGMLEVSESGYALIPQTEKKDIFSQGLLAELKNKLT